MLNALATRVLLDERPPRDRRGVPGGERLYRAHTPPSAEPGERRALYASREVILAGGAFNSPQLLMLSGIGPPTCCGAHGIEPRVPLPGVGTNLQDRYEVGVVNRMNMQAWDVYRGATFGAGDPQFAEWSGRADGRVRHERSRPHGVQAIVARMCRCPTCSAWRCWPTSEATTRDTRRAGERDLNALTWVVLKGTRTTAPAP